MHIDKIASHYKMLPHKQQRRFIKNLMMLFDQEFSALALRGPFRLVLDSNVLMRIEDLEKGGVSEGVLAVLCFFDYFRSQSHYKADLLIQPSVFYEYCRRQAFGTLSNHWERFKGLRDSIERELGIEILFDGITKYSDAEMAFSVIERDASQIVHALISIQERNWLYDFLRSPGGVTGVLRKDHKIEVPPSFAAEHLFEGISTEYFNPHYVELFLRDHIAFALANNPRNDLEVAAKYEKRDGYALRKVLYLTAKQDLRGLADIELFSLCNTQAQFYMQAKGQYWPASIPLTVDENLYLSLKSRSSYGVSSEPIIGGEPQAEIHAKLESSFNDARRRMDRAKEQQERCLAAQDDYAKSISPLFETER
ncbi:hypothetical protein N8H69_04215 [Achromobacter spanius]|uniref:hypothetical protein n=1 Tax=Achromobacter spanius TaxID=217203 RepID=UPI002227EA90|nr:hypothetical protein [Achromobacter spanius]MCW3151727.1 hypothetical protein [Achromobacter spanius]